MLGIGNNNKRKGTNGEPDFPAEMNPEEVVLKISTFEASQNPDYRRIHNGYLKEGPRAYKVAVMYEVINRKTQVFHHFILDIISIQKLKKGWFYTYENKFTLTSEHGEIDALYKFLTLFLKGDAPTETGNYYVVSHADMEEMTPVVSDNVEELVQAVLENPDSYDALVEIGGKDLLMLLAKTAQEKGDGVEIIVNFIDTISSLDGEDKLKALVAIKEQNLSKEDLDMVSGRIDGLNQFGKELFEDQKWAEPDWQKFFEKNTWIFGYGLDYRFMMILQREATVSAVTTAGAEAVNVDFLVGDENFTVLVELKRPDTLLFKKNQNRSGSWKLSNELVDATTQILEQKAEWQIKSRTPQYDADGKLIEQITIDPKSILIIGNTNEFSGTSMQDRIKAETFEMYRRNLRNIEILTFDELFNKARFIVTDK